MHQLRRDALSPVEVVFGACAANGQGDLLAVDLEKLLGRVLTDRLEEAVAQCVADARGVNQVLVDEEPQFRLDDAK